MVSFMLSEYNDKSRRCECNKGTFQPTKETLIKPSLLTLANAKDNQIIDLI